MRLNPDLTQQFNLNPIDALRKVAAQQGGLAGFRVGGKQAYLVSSPELIHQVLYELKLPKRQGRPGATELLGQGVMTSEGELNRLQRARLRPLFGRLCQAGWRPAIEEEAQRLADSWQDGQHLNSLGEFGKLSLAVACRCLLGRRLKQEPILLQALEDCLELRASPAEIRRRLDPICRELLQSARGPLVEILLDAPISDSLRHDEVITMLLGAHETTAAALAWSMRLLALHPQHQPGREVVAEAMRLYPPGWMIARQLDQSLELAGRPLEAPATVLMSPMVTHYLPHLWPRPEEFHPERFRTPPDRCSYFPFGGGERICLGERLAWVESEVALPLIAGQWSLQPLAAGPVTLRAGASLRPACGLPARVARAYLPAKTT
ncbi:MAG: cytochrome P450 [Candidatus Eremiobacteraeota bacterium]|nr:cytochrome P450 [Candidatus Eremiobacteraeota bacterium]